MKIIKGGEKHKCQGGPHQIVVRCCRLRVKKSGEPIKSQHIYADFARHHCHRHFTPESLDIQRSTHDYYIAQNFQDKKPEWNYLDIHGIEKQEEGTEFIGYRIQNLAPF